MIYTNIKKQYKKTAGLILRLNNKIQLLSMVLLHRRSFISEIIILNSDQHQHKKTISTNSTINSEIKQQHTTFVDMCYCVEKFCFRQRVCLLITSLSCMENNFLPNRQGEQTKTQPIFTGCTCVEDAICQEIVITRSCAEQFTHAVLYPIKIC